MRIVSSHLYRALISAGVPDELALDAAEEVADCRRAQTSKRDFGILHYMGGAGLGLLVAIAFKLLS